VIDVLGELWLPWEKPLQSNANMERKMLEARPVACPLNSPNGSGDKKSQNCQIGWKVGSIEEGYLIMKKEIIDNIIFCRTTL
jgi:hypothetical protein